MSGIQDLLRGRGASRASPGSISDVHAINFAWLLWLRWGAIAGQVVAVLVVDRLVAIRLPLLLLAAILGLELLSNAACTLWMRSGRAIHEWMLGVVMLADVVILTVLLALTGGPFNPFTCLYLVYIALGAVVLRPCWTWGIAVLALGCFGALFADQGWLPVEIPSHGHSEQMRMHLEGMWVAFGVAAGFIVYFVQRVTRALGERDAELAAVRNRTARHERLAALATLAAGAAHELATPLSTIAIAAKDLARELERGAGLRDAAADARLIREQVERCRTILEHMATNAGESTGEAIVPVPAAELVESVLRGLPDRQQIRLVMDDEVRSRTLWVPPRAIGQALRGVIENARQASPPGAEVMLRVAAEGRGWRIEVRDHGGGMAPEVLARAGEPFFSTKSPGRGMGLGLFLTRAVLDRLGGELDLASTPGRGTTTTLVLPSGGPDAVTRDRSPALAGS